MDISENEYVANESNLFIPTSRKKLFPEVMGVDIKPLNKGNSQFSFVLPSFMNFINPQKIRMRYDLTMSGRGMPKCNSKAGVHSLFRNMRIQTQNGMKVLENLDDYGVMVAMQYHYSGDAGIRHLRELNEGLSLTNNSAEQLFWNAQNLPSVGITTANTPKKVAINQELYSGVLGASSSILPVGALDGVRVTCEMNPVIKSIKLANDSSKTGPKSLKVKTQVAAADWNNNSLNNIVNIVCKGGDAQDSGFEVGDAVYYDVGGVDTLIGMVTGVTNDGNNDFVLQVRGDVAVSTDWKLLAVDTLLYTKHEDRFNGWTPGVNMQGTSGSAAAAITLAVSEAPKVVDYVMENLEMIVEMVQPHKSYVDLMVKKINSKEGLIMNFKTQNLLRTNLTGVQGQLNASIANTSRRLYAMNIVPLNSVDTLNGENLSGQADHLNDYQLVVNGNLTPSRTIDVSRLSMTPAYVPQQFIQELRKSLISSGVFVRSLQRPEEVVVIGRAFGMGGAVSDVTKSDLQVRLNYSSSATTQKVLNCYMCEARTLIIRDREVDVIV